jgi:hypothetical protein
MGGNALDIHTERLLSADFYRTQQKLSNLFSRRFGLSEETDYHFVRPYHSKSSHGDMDVLVRKPAVDKWKLVNFLGPKETFNNGNVVSLDYKSVKGTLFQLDLVFMRHKWWEMAKAFFAYNDLGNLMGKVARWIGLKHGFQGVRYTHYTEDKSVKLGELAVTTDPETAFELLGFSWDRFEDGFEDLEEVFEYVVDSKYFHRKAFMSENLTADQRHRDTKRKTYQKWMKYLENVPESQNKTRPSKSQVKERVFSMTGVDLNAWETRLEKKHKRREKAREVFNGNVAMNHSNLTGKELGAALGRFKSQFETTEEYHTFLLNEGREKAVKRFKSVNGLD